MKVVFQILFGNTNIRFSVKILFSCHFFLLFDVEIIFMFPWAINVAELGYYGLLKCLYFMGLLFAGLIISL